MRVALAFVLHLPLSEAFIFATQSATGGSQHSKER
jgi:hypothetical protein